MVILCQEHLGIILKQLFPNVQIRTNARKGASLHNVQTGKYLEIDFDITELSLCFEFQDQYHYVTTEFSHIPLEIVQDKDNLKSKKVRELVKTLIQVPFWWDGTKESLLASIGFLRPDIAGNSFETLPIPLNPLNNLSNSFTVPDIGEVMLASFPLSVDAFLDTIHPESPWWVGEKYDGVRCLWNAAQKKLYSRRGLELRITGNHSIICERNKIFIDGELWCGRGSYMESFRIVNSDVVIWPHIRINAFDCPSKNTFELRYCSLLSTISYDNPFLIVVSRLLCRKEHQCTFILKQVINHGGEGLVLRKPASLYEHGRSSSLIKLKVAREDMEAIVVEVLEDACLLKLPSGIRFKTKLPEFRINIGAIVTIDYEGLSEFGIPVHPKISRIRTDLSWKDVLYDYSRHNNKPLSQLHSKPIRYWTANKGENMRKFFFEVARSVNLDPLHPSSWYTMPRKQFIQDKNGIEILRHFNNDHVKALLWAFPDISLEPNKFSSTVTRWRSAKERRNLLEKYAKSASLDPLVASHWYSVDKEALLRTDGVAPMLEIYYEGRLRNAVSHLFPEIGFEQASFVKAQRIKKHRKMLLQMATDIEIDPLVPESWYSVTAAKIQSFPAIRTLLNLQYGGQLSTALLTLFPEMQFDESKFKKQDYWDIVKEFFVSFAKESNFDPHIATNWYSVNTALMHSRPRAKFVLSHYKGNLVKTLMHAFPNIGLLEARFATVPHLYWKNIQKRRDFLGQFAINNDFDPLVAENWYSLPLASVLQDKATRSMLNQSYDGKLGTALTHLFPEIGFSITKFKQMHGVSKSATITRMLL